MSTVTRNRAAVITNPGQDINKFKRVLCLCSAGCLRSPTAAVVLAGEPFNFNTRAAGLDTYHAIIPVDEGLLLWADEIVVMAEYQIGQVLDFMLKFDPQNHWPRPIINLNIPDMYNYREPALVRLIETAYKAQQ